jgi:hypothetical protein
LKRHKKSSHFEGFDKNPGSENGNTNLPSLRPTQSTFPPSDNTGRPGSSSVFVPPSTSGTFSTDGTEGDFSTTPFVGGGSSYPDPSSNTRPSSQTPDDLYTIKNNYPATYPTSNRPQTGTQPEAVAPTHPVEPNRPTHETHPHPIEPERPPPHHPYPVGPDPFPDYFPHTHPHYHYDHDYTDDRDSHFPGIYAHNSPSFYPGAPQSHINNHYGPASGGGGGGLYASGRYPDSDHHLGQAGGYNANRKNGYQVTDNSPDIPMVQSE